VAPTGEPGGADGLHARRSGNDIADALDQLHAGGWNIGDTTFFDVEDGGQVWMVTGTNGENRIRAEGATCRMAGARFSRIGP
jgi:hypothetical protein